MVKGKVRTRTSGSNRGDKYPITPKRDVHRKSGVKRPDRFITLKDIPSWSKYMLMDGRTGKVYSIVKGNGGYQIITLPENFPDDNTPIDIIAEDIGTLKEAKKILHSKGILLNKLGETGY